LDHRVVLVELRNGDDRSIRFEAERDVRLEELAGSLALADVLARQRSETPLDTCPAKTSSICGRSLGNDLPMMGR
jgi:hypothetical protein